VRRTVLALLPLGARTCPFRSIRDPRGGRGVFGVRRIVSPRAAGEEESRRTLRDEPPRLRIREVSVLRDVGPDGGFSDRLEGRAFELLPGVVLVGRFAEGRFALGRFAEGRFALGRFAVGGFAAGRFAVGRFAEGRFVLGRFAVGGFAVGFSTGRFAVGRLEAGPFSVGRFVRGRSRVGFLPDGSVAVCVLLVARVRGFPAGFPDGLAMGLVRRMDGALIIDLAPGLMLDALAGRVESG